MNKKNSKLFEEITSIQEVFIKIFVEMPFPLLFFDKNGKIVLANRLFCSLTGIMIEDILLRNESFISYLARDNAAEFQEAMNDIYRDDPDAFYHEVSPVSILAHEKVREEAAAFTRAVLYPLYDKSDNIAAGVAVFLK